MVVKKKFITKCPIFIRGGHIISFLRALFLRQGSLPSLEKGNAPWEENVNELNSENTAARADAETPGWPSVQC